MFLMRDKRVLNKRLCGDVQTKAKRQFSVSFFCIQGWYIIPKQLWTFLDFHQILYILGLV